ncbi:MAG: NAD(+) synthase [Flavobacterium sp.]|uniref:NAD(+) synthase n=1 Tax=Flavobacterium sp. TaxID=239 RepID=UPI00262C3589|nr:NAD(+) synthase [Flavobacterium sp.]MDD5152023.1 NAD(+) synthase [Flavobacterium sp.]
MKPLLEDLRRAKNFDVEPYVKEKIDKINDFFLTERLDSAVIGLSGGIDSSIVVALLCLAAREKNSPIRIVKGISLPIHTRGVSGQEDSVRFVQEYLLPYMENYNSFRYELKDLTSVMKEFILNEYTNDFAKGQLAAIIRTPYLYFSVAKMQVDDFRPIVVGTTNRDEGAYIGFFGKASDAMVDLQPIADIHKSEVYKVAEYLKIPRKIIDRDPTGDIFDGSTDKELIRAPYDMIEYHQLLDDHDFKPNDAIYYHSDFLERRYIFNCFEKIEEIHRKNVHKYKVGMSSRFIDVLPRITKNLQGWK